MLVHDDQTVRSLRHDIGLCYLSACDPQRMLVRFWRRCFGNFGAARKRRRRERGHAIIDTRRRRFGWRDGLGAEESRGRRLLHGSTEQEATRDLGDHRFLLPGRERSLCGALDAAKAMLVEGTA